MPKGKTERTGSPYQIEQTSLNQGTAKGRQLDKTLSNIFTSQDRLRTGKKQEDEGGREAQRKREDGRESAKYHLTVFLEEFS